MWFYAQQLSYLWWSTWLGTVPLYNYISGAPLSYIESYMIHTEDIFYALLFVFLQHHSVNSWTPPQVNSD